MFYAFARKRLRARDDILIVCVRLRLRRWVPVWRELKWFCPAFRAISLPFLVTLIRFVYDLFVFIWMLLLL